MGVCAFVHASVQGVYNRLPLHQITPHQSCWLTLRDLVQYPALTVGIAYRKELSWALSNLSHTGSMEMLP